MAYNKLRELHTHMSRANIYANTKKDKSTIDDRNLGIEFRAIIFTTHGGFGTSTHALIKNKHSKSLTQKPVLNPLARRGRVMVCLAIGPDGGSMKHSLLLCGVTPNFGIKSMRVAQPRLTYIGCSACTCTRPIGTNTTTLCSQAWLWGRRLRSSSSALEKLSRAVGVVAPTPL